MKGGKRLTVCGVFILLIASWILPVWGCAKSQAKEPGAGMTDTGAGLVRDTGARPAIKDTGVLRWLALGDSYTIGQSVGENDRYPVQAMKLLQQEGIPVAQPEIIAVTGWTTQNLLDALKGKTANPPYSIVTLLIGVNNQYQGRSTAEYATQFTSLLEQSIQLAGGRPQRVIVLSIPDYSVTPFAAGRDRAAIARDIDAFNAVNRQLSDQYKTPWLDVTTASRMAAGDPSLVAADSLHFSGKEYGVWAGLLAPVIGQALTR